MGTLATLAAFATLAICLCIFIYWNQAHESFQSQHVKGIFLNRIHDTLLTVDLEVARTPTAIEQGLMHRTHLAPHTGMLFWFDKEAIRSFWMRNTLVPLDMVFVTSTGRISNIFPSVPPKTEDLRTSSEPVQYVVELPGGTMQKYGIRAGDSFRSFNKP